MRSIFARLVALIKGLFGLRVSTLELAHPESALDSFVERHRQGVAHLFDGVATLAAAVEVQRNLLQNQLTKLDTVERQLRAATRRQDQVRGPRLLGERHRLLQNIATTRESLRQQEAEQQAMTDQLHDAKLNLEQTKAEGVSLCAQLKYQRAQEVATRALDSVLSPPEDQLISRMRNKVSAGRARAQLAQELEHGPGGETYAAMSDAYEDEFARLCGQQTQEDTHPSRQDALEVS